ncbi:MAG: RNA polymerase sigma-70 factor [Bacteroidales bacterium]|jgi:RNA polymerase sigma-70 factor (ECF subfamily)|nr:RNA polymerase sigma-70 factor [Bacteroidales bacterium]
MKYSEKDIIKKISKGDIQLFEVLFKEYYQLLCEFGMKYLKNIEEVEEVVQDVFYNIWKNRHQLKINTSIKSYLYTAVRNNSLQKIRIRSLNLKYENYYKSHPVNESISPADEMNAKELKSIINQALNTLPEKCRIIFQMSRYEGLKYHEIASKLSISIKTVESNMGKALKHFRNYLKDYAEAV